MHNPRSPATGYALAALLGAVGAGLCQPVKNEECIAFLQDVLPKLGLRWAGFRKVRRLVCKRIAKRVRELALDDLQGYRRYLDLNIDEWQKLDAMCRIPISHFYRDRAVFSAIRTGNMTRATCCRAAALTAGTIR